MIKIWIMAIKPNQWYWTVPNKCSVAKLMVLFRTGWSRFIKNLSLISRKYLVFPCLKVVNSPKEGLWWHYKRWPCIQLSLDGFFFYESELSPANLHLEVFILILRAFYPLCTQILSALSQYTIVLFYAHIGSLCSYREPVT